MKYVLNFRNNHGTDQELLDDMKKVSDKIGTKKLTSKIYNEHGAYSYESIKRRFNSWNKALIKAGLEVTVSYDTSEKDLFENLEKVWIALGKQPGKRDLKKPLSNYSETSYITKFGSWKNALVKFVEFINSSSNLDQEELIEQETDITKVKNKVEHKHKTKRTPSERLKVQVLMRDGNICRLCGITVTGENIHFDHIKPWSKGGETTLENLQILCALHNLAKGDLEYES
ncbi:MAG: endonuclease [Sphingobacteriaceae bacterium]|nr:endonuclease [Sphingobacteriaceae bacterium]